MKVSNWLQVGLAVGLLPAALAACSSGSTAGSGGAGGGASTSTSSSKSTSTSASTSTSTSSSSGGAGDAQTPPQGETALKAWLATGAYKMWHCEMAEHASKAPSPHSFNRICSNTKLSTNAAGATYPAGAAGVKELWDMVGGKIIGYAVYLKLGADSAAGAGWYYYEDNPTINPPGGVVADGKGDSGSAKMICVGCHSLAGSDAAHFGHDFAYTQVP